MKKENQDLKGLSTRQTKIIEQTKDDNERVKKENERQKEVIKTTKEDLEKVKIEIPALRETNKKLIVKNEEFVKENKRITQDLEVSRV